MATKEARDARLDALVANVDAWQKEEQARLKREVARLKQIQRGRSGADRLRSTLTDAASDLLNQQLADFLG